MARETLTRSAGVAGRTRLPLSGRGAEVGEKVESAPVPARATLARFLYRYLAGYRRMVLLAIIVTVVEVGADILGALPLKFILDKVINHRDPHAPLLGHLLTLTDPLGTSAGLRSGETHTQIGIIVASAIVLVALGTLNAVLSFAQIYLAAYVGQGLSTRLRTHLFDHLQGLPLGWHDRQRTGDLVQRVVGNVSDVEKLVTDGLVDLLAGLLTLVGILTAMLLLNASFTLLAVVVVPVLFAIVLFYTRRIKKATKRSAALAGQISEVATEDLRAIIEVKTFRLEGRESDRFSRSVGHYRAAVLGAAHLQAQFTPLVGVVVALATAGVVGVGASVAAGHTVGLGVVTIPAGTITIGTLTVFLAYLKQLYQPMRDLSKLTNVAAAASSAVERIDAVFDATPEVMDTVRDDGPRRLNGAIRFTDVTFGYEPTRPVLTGIDLDIPAGRRVALVGLSGGGKTTLVKLIPRFYDRQAGQLTLDGRDVRDYPLAVVRDNVSVVLQDAVLFEGTVRDNLTIGRPEATDAQVVAAARRAHIHDTIAALDGGYEARVREGGKNLSSGQRQRLGIARAILRDAPILILDEPTANLDVEAEGEVMRALDTAMEGRTVLMISHRLSTLGHVDEIVVLKDGRIAERGTYRALERAGGVFAGLLAEQNRYASGTPSGHATDELERIPTARPTLVPARRAAGRTGDATDQPPPSLVRGVGETTTAPVPLRRHDRRATWRGRAVALPLGALAAVGLVHVAQAPPPLSPSGVTAPMRGANDRANARIASDVAAHAGPGDAVLLDAGVDARWYAAQARLNLPIYQLPMAGDTITTAEETALRTIEAGRVRLWLIPSLTPGGAVAASLRRSLARDATQQRMGGAVDRRGTAAPGLMLYTLRPRPAAPVQVRPLTVRQGLVLAGWVSARTHAPTVPFGPAGAAGSLVGAPLIPPRPATVWHLPFASGVSSRDKVRLTLLNPNPRPTTVTIGMVSARGVAIKSVGVPARAAVEIKLYTWGAGARTAALQVHALLPIVPLRSVATRTTVRYIYGLRGP